jgi:hypothetical protein
MRMCTSSSPFKTELHSCKDEKSWKFLQTGRTRLIILIFIVQALLLLRYSRGLIVSILSFICSCRDNGTVVPVGKGIPSNKKNLVLNYNEYIVYNPSQVKLKYLLQVEFKYK